MGENLVIGLFAALSLIFISVLFRFWRKHKRQKVVGDWRAVFFGNLLLFLTLVSMLLFGGECYYRFCYDKTDSLDYTKTSTRWFERYWHTNSTGCRDNVEYTLSIPRDKHRVTFLGDSFTAGQGIKNVDDRFVNRIRHAHPEWDVHMLAQLGFDTDNELSYLKDCIEQGYEIDKVVLVYCLNDVSDLIPAWTNSITRIYADLDRSGWLVHNSFFINTVYHRFNVWRRPEMKSYFDFINQGYEGTVFEQQRNRLIALRNLVREHHGSLFVVTFPFVNAIGAVYPYRSAHDTLTRFWAGMEVPQLDLLPALEKVPGARLTVNSMDAHPNEYAHVLAAKAVDRFLTENIK